MAKAKKVKAEIVSAIARADAERLERGILDDFRAAGERLVEAAIKLDRFIRGQGWLPLGFRTMTEWREARVPWSNYNNARHTLKLLTAGVPEAEVKRVGKKTNIENLVRLPKKYWADGKWLKLAETMPVVGFGELVEKELERAGMHPEAYTVRLGTRVPAGLAEKIDLALKVAEAEGNRTAAERLEAIFSDYLGGASGEPGLSREQWFEWLTAR